MTTGYSKLMQGMKKDEAKMKQDKLFVKQMLKSSRTQSKMPKAQLSHGSYSASAKTNLYKCARKTTKVSWDNHMKELMRPSK